MNNIIFIIDTMNTVLLPDFCCFLFSSRLIIFLFAPSLSLPFFLFPSTFYFSPSFFAAVFSTFFHFQDYQVVGAADAAVV